MNEHLPSHFKISSTSKTSSLHGNKARKTSGNNQKARTWRQQIIFALYFDLLVPDRSIFRSLKTGLKIAECVGWALQGDGTLVARVTEQLVN